MAWIPDITRPTRATLAIANAPARFTQTEIAQQSGVALTTISPVIKELELLGMVAVCRVGQRGIKTWRKTEKYRLPDGIKAASVTGVSPPLQRRVDEKERALQAALERLNQLETAMRGWRVEATCA